MAQTQTIEQSHLATLDVLVGIRNRIPQGANPSLTTDPVLFAFTPGGMPPKIDPVDSDWVAGDWLPTDRVNYARCLVGPDGGAIVLEPGANGTRLSYTIWVKVVDNPTTFVDAVGTLIIT